MHPYPHRYRVRIGAAPAGELTLNADGLAEIRSLPPPEFGGPGGYWSPETLLLAAVGDCMMLTFRAIAKASRFEWRELSAEVEGLLERIDGNGRFTEIKTHVRLVVPPGTDTSRAQKLLEKSEQGCPISNSLSAKKHVDWEIVEHA
jgi:organic hydroperoxide reductase OsmC/OhrA